MLTLPSSLRVFAKTGPTDMRKSFEGLVGVVERELRQQVESGDLFLFFNRRGDRVKVLWFAGDGLVHLVQEARSHTTPISSLFTEIGDTAPIISLTGLLRLSEWIQARQILVQGGDPCQEKSPLLLPPAPSLPRVRSSGSVVESADRRPATTNAGNAQRHRRATTRRALRRTGGAHERS